jgi:hypothetical protein
VVMVGELDANNNLLGLTPLGNVPNLEITVDVSVEEHNESQSGQRGTDMRKEKETKVGIKMTCQNFVRDVLAMFLRGTVTPIAAGEVTAGALVCRLGKIMPLPHIKVSDVVLKKATTTLVAYVDDDTPYDYQLNADAGSIRFAATPATSGLVDDDALTIAYDYAAQAQVDSLTTGAVARFLRFEGLNTADSNDPMIVEAFRCQFDPAKVLSLISDELAQSFELEGSILADLSRTSGSKYFRERLLR